jgi:hypothetical protein
MKSLYLIYRKLTKEEEKELQNNSLQGAAVVLYEKEAFLSEETKENIGAQPIKSTINPNKINEEHLSRIAALGDTKIGDKVLRDHLMDGSNSLWYYLKFSVFHRSASKVQQVHSLLAILSQYEGIKTTIYNELSLPGYFFKNNVVFRASSKKKRSAIPYLIKYLFLFASRAVIGLLLLPFRLKKEACNLILCNPYNYQSILDKDTGSPIQADPHLGYLIKDSRKNTSFMLLSQIRAINLSQSYKFGFFNYFKLTKDSKRTIFFEPFLFIAFLSKNFHSRRKKINTQLLHFEQLVKITSWEDPYIRLSVETLLQSKKMLSQALWREEASKYLSKFQAIKSLTLIDEHSLKNRSLWYPLQKEEVKVLAVQHGAISSGNIAYRFVKADESKSLLPDVTLIRGTYTRNMLINDSVYTDSKLQITGHMRTDVIPTLLKQTSSQVSDNERPIILYATQPIQASDRQLKLRQYEDFFKVCKSLPGFDFIIKPHPNEADLSIYHSLAQKHGVKNFQVSTEDLYIQLAKSSLVITYFSTVGIEAIYFGKELITLDYNELDLQGFSRSEICHNVHNAEELTSTIQQIILHGKKVSPLNKAKFIEQRAYKIDGLSTQRHLNAILA